MVMIGEVRMLLVASACAATCARAGGGRKLLMAPKTLQSYCYISLFAPFFDIPVSLGNLFQGIASIYDRFYLSLLDKLFEEN